MGHDRAARAGRRPPEREKQAISEACQAFIEQVLKPRFLPEIRPTDFNYPIDIFGKWHGGKYRFIQRFRSDREDALEPQFARPCAHDREGLPFTPAYSGRPRKGSSKFILPSPAPVGSFEISEQPLFFARSGALERGLDLL